jgi:hypothetical protein
MAYGTDVTVFVEDKAGDLGAVPSPAPWWLSPDVDIPAHPGEARQGANTVQIRVHSQEEPIIEQKIVAEVYVGNPSLAMSPTANTRRIDPGNLRFRPPNVAGTEPVATQAGGTLTFSWTPSGTAGDVDGLGHRCLVLRAFPEDVTPPTSPFDVPNEQHEAQRNIEIVSTAEMSGSMSKGGAGTPDDPRRIDKATGKWWERIETIGPGRRGRRYTVWAFDPRPNRLIQEAATAVLGKRGFKGFSKQPPYEVSIDPGDNGKQLDPGDVWEDPGFAEPAGIGSGLWANKRLLAAARFDVGPRKPMSLILRWDHSGLEPRTGAVLHGAQWNERGEPEGGITIVAMAPSPAPRKPRS